MAKTKKQPSFNKIMRLAGQLVEAVASSATHYDNRIHGRSAAIRGIHTTMELIAKTPNATVNREALDEWAGQVVKARRDLESWMKDRLKPGGKHSKGILDEEVPF